MPRPTRRIRKEDIGDPSNFVHVQHVGFGPKPTPNKPQDGDFTPENGANVSPNTTAISEDNYSKVERRIKGPRSSQIPRHHRSTTTCTFPSEGENPYPVSRKKSSTRNSNDCNGEDSSGGSPDSKPLTKPMFGSLLNLSFLPLGMGKSSSKSPSINKTKRMSLLNLTASNLFAQTPKQQYEENRESVHMTGYVRRRSFSNSKDDNNDSSVKTVHKDKAANAQQLPHLQGYTGNVPTRIPLAKLGRSKSTLSDFAKRPKLRLKITPPVVPPPTPPNAVSTRAKNKINVEKESLPSPPPSPIPSPPPSPVPDTLPPILQQVDEVILRRSPKAQARSRIIQLPSRSSVDSVEPSSPQYLTPAGGSSPLLDNESTWPLSPTIPPSSTPFFPANRSAPGTPPIWPLQPSWPSVLSRHSKEATIPEIPSPTKEEMETIEESEYAPVVSIVDSFMSNDNAEPNSSNADAVGRRRTQSPIKNETDEQCLQFLTVNPFSIASISPILRENIQYTQWSRVGQRLFEFIPAETLSKSDGGSGMTSGAETRENELYESMLSKTLELWIEKAGDQANIDNLLTILKEENHHQATESLREIFQNTQM